MRRTVFHVFLSDTPKTENDVDILGIISLIFFPGSQKKVDEDNAMLHMNSTQILSRALPRQLLGT